MQNTTTCHADDCNQINLAGTKNNTSDIQLKLIARGIFYILYYPTLQLSYTNMWLYLFCPFGNIYFRGTWHI